MDINTPSQHSESKRKHPHGNNTGLKQAYELRDFAAEGAMDLKNLEANTLEEKVARAKALRDFAFTWNGASERIRIIRNRPMPGSFRPTAKTQKSQKTQSIAPVVDGVE